MQEKLDTIATTVTEMKSSLWTEESLNRLIVFQLMQYLQTMMGTIKEKQGQQ